MVDDEIACSRRLGDRICRARREIGLPRAGGEAESARPHPPALTGRAPIPQPSSEEHSKGGGAAREAVERTRRGTGKGSGSARLARGAVAAARRQGLHGLPASSTCPRRPTRCAERGARVFAQPRARRTGAVARPAPARDCWTAGGRVGLFGSLAPSGLGLERGAAPSDQSMGPSIRARRGPLRRPICCHRAGSRAAALVAKPPEDGERARWRSSRACATNATRAAVSANRPRRAGFGQAWRRGRVA